MAGLGSGHQYWTNGSSKVMQKTISREDKCRRNFEVEKYGFTRPFNPITGAIDTDVLTRPTLSSLDMSSDEASTDKRAEFIELQRQSLVDRLRVDQLKVKRSQLQAELRSVDLRMSLDPVLRVDGRKEIPPTSAEDENLLKEIFKRHTKVSVTWSDKRSRINL